jgi:hypothetical protein
MWEISLAIAFRSLEKFHPANAMALALVVRVPVQVLGKFPDSREIVRRYYNKRTSSVNLSSEFETKSCTVSEL